MFGREYVYERGYADHAHATWEWLVPVLLLALLVAAVAWVAWELRSRRSASVPAGTGPAAVATAASDPAVEELRLRYARGEVTTEEYSTIAVGLGAVAPQPVPWPAAPAVETVPGPASGESSAPAEDPPAAEPKPPAA